MIAGVSVYSEAMPKVKKEIKLKKHRRANLKTLEKKSMLTLEVDIQYCLARCRKAPSTCALS